MRLSTASLHIGSRLQRDGRLWTVTELHADRVLLRSATRAIVVSISDLVDDPHTVFASEQPVPGAEAGVAIDNLTPGQRADWLARLGHVREVLTGYRSGRPDVAQPGEPRPAYRPELGASVRCQAKANEIGVSDKTVSRWMTAYRRDGPAALIDGRAVRIRPPLATLDQRWVDMCRTVCDELRFAATHTKKYVLAEVASRLQAEYGKGTVAIPAKSLAYGALDEITCGTNMFRGSAKGRREIADRPEGAYGRLAATRLGEYVILDTTRLDVYAMEKATYRWVNTELTVAMDVYGKIICGLRLAPVSTRSSDVASVLFEVVCPRPTNDPKHLPFIGLPERLIVPTDLPSETPAEACIPIECVVVDHGKVYMSDHIRAVLERFGISIQPVRRYKGSDKGPLERWFRTLREGLLEYLDGYMGPDVYSRGKDAEAGAFYFVDELEAIIRRWVREVYHQHPHDGLVVPAAPGLRLSPNAMYDVGVATTGYRRIPTSHDTVYDFLPVEWRRINHYGIDFHKLRYDGDVLGEFAERISPYTGRHAGKYPIRYDPGDISRIYFQHPDTGDWHQIKWVHADELRRPFSLDALRYARTLAAQRDADRFPDDRLALTDLLNQWSRSSTMSRRERKVAVQLLDESSAGWLRHELDDRAAEIDPVQTLYEYMGGVASDDDVEIDDDELADSEDFYRHAMENLD